MSNVVTLHEGSRWKAMIEYDHQNGPISIEHFFEEISDVHRIIENGPDWNTLIRYTVTLHRPDGGEAQSSNEKPVRQVRSR
jgi:hypothetical protein